MLPALLASPAGQLLAAGLTAYVTWWAWAFKIWPMLNPQDPKQYPYWIPFIGHAIAFSKDSDLTFTKARKYFGDTRQPFAITVVGQIFYVVTSPEDTNLVYRNTKTLTFDEFIQDMLQTLGVSEKGLRSAFPEEPDSKPLPYYGQEIYRTQFLPGPEFSKLWQTIFTRLVEALAFDNVPEVAVLGSSGQVKRLSLWKWTRTTLVNVVTRALFGDVLLEIEPNLVDLFSAFDDESWKLTHKYPKYAAKELHEALHRLTLMFVKYFGLPAEKRSAAASVIHVLEAKFREFGLEGKDLALCFVMPLWVINSNAYKLCFWMMALIVHDPQLRKEICDESRDALVSDANDSGSRLEQCSKMVAVYNEILRVNTSSASIRGIATDTKIGNLVLRAGNKVMIPYRQLHLNEGVWGLDASKFNPHRFASQDLTKSPSFRPFGGGNTYCTGRYVALREVLTFVSVAIQRLNAIAPPSDDRSPDQVMDMVDQTMPTLGILPPLPGRDCEVLISRV